MGEPVKVLIDLMPLIEKIRYELELEAGRLPDEGLHDFLQQIADYKDYSEEVTLAALRNGLTYAVLEAAKLEVARRVERSLNASKE